MAKKKLKKKEAKVEKEIKELDAKTEKSAKEIEKELKLTEKIEQKLAIEKLKETKAGGVFGGFFEFLQKYSVIGLAIGLVIGDSSKLLVNSIVAGLINPFIGLFLPNNEGLKAWKVGEFLIGNILYEAINFMIILFLIYFVIKILLRREDILEKK